MAALALGFFAVMFAVENMGKKTVEPHAVEAIYTQPLCSEIIGYNDIIPLKITMEKGIISNIEILDNRETPKYLRRVVEGGLVEKFYGLTPSEAAEYNVDAISGATFSSNAIVKSVRATMKNYEETHHPSIWGWQLLGVILSAAAIFVLSAITAKKRKVINR